MLHNTTVQLCDVMTFDSFPQHTVYMTVAQKIIVWWDKPSSPAFRDLKRKDHGYEFILSNTDVLSEKSKENKRGQKRLQKKGRGTGGREETGKGEEGQHESRKISAIPMALKS